MYKAADNRYEQMTYNRVGKSGLKLPAISLGLWHNFGGVDTIENGEKIILKAFDKGITHFDLANNYGPPAGSAEETFGQVLKKQLSTYRDEMIISTKAGYYMWPGPYGEWGSKKYITASLDQSLQRMQVDYVDIFYSHRFDPETPIEETVHALDNAVRQGKALYVGISNYDAQQTQEAIRLFKEYRTPFVIHQPRYNMFDRFLEGDLSGVLRQEGKGAIVYSPLAQGLLTDKYLNGIPNDSRAAKETGFLQRDTITEKTVNILKQLNEVAKERQQSLAQMAIAWLLRLEVVSSVLVGASRVEQLENSLQSLKNLEFSSYELKRIESILAQK